MHRVASNPWNPWKTLKLLIPLKRPLKSLKIAMVPEKIWKKACKNQCLVQNDCSGSYIFNFGSYIFACDEQLLSLHTASITYFFYFPLFVFIQVNSHCPRAARAPEKPSIDTEIVQEDANMPGARILDLEDDCVWYFFSALPSLFLLVFVLSTVWVKHPIRSRLDLAVISPL